MSTIEVVAEPKSAPARPASSEQTSLRILHVAQPTTEGVARCVGNLAGRQIRAGHDVTVACPPGGDLPRWVLDAGAKLEPWPATRTPSPQVIAETRRLRSLIEGVDPELVHLHSAKAGLAGRMVVRGRLPTLFQPHAWSWLAASGPVRAGARNWERRAVRWTDRIVCVSEEEVRLGREAGVSARYEVVPNGVDLAAYPFADDTERRFARSRLGLNPDAPTVVCIGRLSRQKGQDVLIEAWPRVARTVDGARLYLVGDGPDRSELEAKAPGGVVFAGTKADVPDWLAAADVIALPSRWEGMSMVMLEAMATGRPVVASDVAGASEALRGDGGAVVPPEDNDALSTALIVRLEDPYRARNEGMAGRSRVEAAHSLEVAAQRTERIYYEVLEERGMGEAG